MSFISSIIKVFVGDKSKKDVKNILQDYYKNLKKLKYQIIQITDSILIETL